MLSVFYEKERSNLLLPVAADLSAVIDEVSENTNKSNGTDVAKMEKYYSCPSIQMETYM